MGFESEGLNENPYTLHPEEPEAQIWTQNLRGPIAA